jgi:hypothetical protein
MKIFVMTSSTSFVSDRDEPDEENLRNPKCRFHPPPFVGWVVADIVRERGFSIWLFLRSLRKLCDAFSFVAADPSLLSQDFFFFGAASTDVVLSAFSSF